MDPHRPPASMFAHSCAAVQVATYPPVVSALRFHVAAADELPKSTAWVVPHGKAVA